MFPNKCFPYVTPRKIMYIDIHVCIYVHAYICLHAFLVTNVLWKPTYQYCCNEFKHEMWQGASNFILHLHYDYLKKIPGSMFLNMSLNRV